MVAYADDINLMGRFLRAAKEAFENLKTEGNKVGLISFSRGAIVGYGVLIREVSRSHTTHHTR
jgi:hypothetical protein